MTKEYGDYVYDIFEAMNDISDFVTGMSFEEFANDKKTVDAVIRSLEVIGSSKKDTSRIQGTLSGCSMETDDSHA
jgi:uncharacterized protein with HEPN domain